MITTPLQAKTKKITTQTYSFEIPEKWEIEHDHEGIISIFDPDGKGAITISSYFSEGDSPDAVNSLKKFVNGRGDIKRKNTDTLDIAESEYEDLNKGNITFVYVVTICKDNQLLLISYNCNKRNFFQDELDAVKKIIGTMEIKNSEDNRDNGNGSINSRKIS